jgi:hypothetical protein
MNMAKKSLLFLAVVLFVTAGSTVQAVVMIQSISATNVGVSFVGSAGVLTMNGVGGINVEYTDGTVTYGSGQFFLNTTLAIGGDHSSGGIASGSFVDGDFYYKDVSKNLLLSGDIEYFNLTEIYNNSGLFWGEGRFAVTGGDLQANFGSIGNMVDISYSITPNTISDFSSSSHFTGSSNMTVLPIPEPMTIGFLSLGSLMILLKRKHS